MRWDDADIGRVVEKRQLVVLDGPGEGDAMVDAQVPRQALKLRDPLGAAFVTPHNQDAAVDVALDHRRRVYEDVHPLKRLDAPDKENDPFVAEAQLRARAFLLDRTEALQVDAKRNHGDLGGISTVKAD